MEDNKKLEYWLRYFGMPEENIENCMTQIAQGYGACRYLDGVSDGADAVNELSKEEPVSMWHDASEEPKPNMELICVGQYGNPLVLSSNSDSFKSRDISKWAYFNDLLNLSNVQRTVKNWKEPISEYLDLEILCYWRNELTTEDVVSINRENFADIARHFANWQKEKTLKESEDAIQYVKENHSPSEVSDFQNAMNIAVMKAFDAGKEKMREQMMKDATEVTVKIDAGGYPYIPQIELYDYDKDVPLVKEGDKVKVKIIKED